MLCWRRRREQSLGKSWEGRRVLWRATNVHLHLRACLPVGPCFQCASPESCGISKETLILTLAYLACRILRPRPVCSISSRTCSRHSHRVHRVATWHCHAGRPRNRALRPRVWWQWLVHAAAAAGRRDLVLDYNGTCGSTSNRRRQRARPGSPHPGGLCSTSSLLEMTARSVPCYEDSGHRMRVSRPL